MGEAEMYETRERIAEDHPDWQYNLGTQYDGGYVLFYFVPNKRTISLYRPADLAYWEGRLPTIPDIDRLENPLVTALRAPASDDDYEYVEPDQDEW